MKKTEFTVYLVREDGSRHFLNDSGSPKWLKYIAQARADFYGEPVEAVDEDGEILWRVEPCVGTRT